MNGILYSVYSKLCSYSIWSEILSNFRVQWSSQFSERPNSVLLPHFKYDARTSCHVFYDGHKLWQNTFVDFEELFRCCFLQGKHLQRRYFKAFFKDDVYYLACITLCYHMRLNNTASAVIEKSCRSHSRSKEKVAFSLITWP